MLTSVYGKR